MPPSGDVFSLLPVDVLMTILNHLMVHPNSEAVAVLITGSAAVYHSCYEEPQGKNDFRDLLSRHYPGSVCACFDDLVLSAALDLRIKCASCGAATVRATISTGLQCHTCRLCRDWFLVPQSLVATVASRKKSPRVKGRLGLPAPETTSAKNHTHLRMQKK
jgi:hypothetical protein